MAEYKTQCAWCNTDFTPLALSDCPREWQDHDRTRYCSVYCKKTAERAYDNYVDPLGFYQSKAGDPYE